MYILSALFSFSPPFLNLLILSSDIELNPGPNKCLCTLNIRSVLHPLQSTALPDIIQKHHPDLFCLIETWIKSTTTPTKLTHCTSSNYTFMSFPLTFVNHRSSTATDGGTGFLIRKPFTQLPSSLPKFSSFEVSSLHFFKVSFCSIYLPFLLSSELTSFLSIVATTLHTNLLLPETSTYLMTILASTSPPSFYLFYPRST